MFSNVKYGITTDNSVDLYCCPTRGSTALVLFFVVSRGDCLNWTVTACVMFSYEDKPASDPKNS